MLTPRTSITRRILAALDASPSRVPVLLGPCGSGRTTVLDHVRDRIGRSSVQYVAVDRVATTPERFFHALTTSSPFAPTASAHTNAHTAFEAALTFFDRARANGGPAVFLLDEFLELRTFESFPGLRRVLYDFSDRLAASGNRFVLTSRYTARTLRLLRDRSSRFEVIHMPALTAEDTLDILGRADGAARDTHDQEFTARTVAALADGRPSYVRALADELSAHREHGGHDPISALTASLASEGTLARQCLFSYELRLHRARGYGALKAILDILAEEEGLTLTAISQRLQRTPGSTKDYLSWLEDVDLVTSRQKRYSYTDPLMRVWVRLHCRPMPPTDEEIVREVHRYAMPRLPQTPEPALVMAAAGSSPTDDERKEWGIIEID